MRQSRKTMLFGALVGIVLILVIGLIQNNINQPQLTINSMAVGDSGYISEMARSSDVDLNGQTITIDDSPVYSEEQCREKATLHCNTKVERRKDGWHLWLTESKDAFPHSKPSNPTSVIVHWE